MVNYNEVWNKVKKIIDVKFHSKPVYDEKYIKTKVKIFNEIVNFLDNEIQKKKNIYYIFIPEINIDSVKGIDKKNYPERYLEESKYKIKKKKIAKFIDVELGLDDSDNSNSE